MFSSTKNYWFRSNHTPAGSNVLKESSGGLSCDSHLRALDIIWNSLTKEGGTVSGIWVWKLLEGGELGELMARTNEQGKNKIGTTPLLPAPNKQNTEVKPDTETLESIGHKVPAKTFKSLDFGEKTWHNRTK